MTESLPALVDRAQQRLAGARTSAEVIEARDAAKAALHYAKLTKAANETQGDCLRLIKRAEIRLADEVDAGQSNGEVAKPNQPVSQYAQASGIPATLDDIGIDSRRLAEWRQLRDAGDEVVEEAIQTALDRGQAPTQADVRRAVVGQHQRERAERLPAVEAPVGTYGTIVIDPPWPMAKINRDVRPNQTGFDYPTMTIDEIEAIDLPSLADTDCHLFVWTTQKFLPASLYLLDCWGFRYCLTMVWHKPGGFQPIGLPQYNCEFAVYGRRGSPRFVDTKNFRTCFDAPRREHSRKPDLFYEMIARVTERQRLDMFAREQRDGFDIWGNEAE